MPSYFLFWFSMKTSHSSKHAFCTHLPSSLFSSIFFAADDTRLAKSRLAATIPILVILLWVPISKKQCVLTIASTVLLLLDDLPTCLLNNKKGVQVETFIEIRFSCLHGLGNSSILTPWLLFLWCTRSWCCLSHFEVGLCSETDFKEVGLDLVFQAIKTK